jgi:membrane complex biogenesis BtpA family protein
MTLHPSRLVGVVHLPALPGAPRSTSTCAQIAQAAAADARVLAEAGFDLAILENFGDTPFFAERVPQITVSAMTACALAVRQARPDLPIGINVLRNDAEAALAIAAVVGAACIRVNVHVGSRVTDQGLVQGRAAETLRARRALGAEHAAIWADVDVKHSAALAPRDVAREADDLVVRGLADVVLVTGEGTGRGVDEDKLRRVREATTGVPVYVASGATLEALPRLALLCDGVVVGSALRTDGRAGGPVDVARAAAFAAAFRRAF